MKNINKLLVLFFLSIAVASCYEKPPAPVDNIIKESLGSVPSASDFQWISADPASSGQVSFTFLFWSDTEIASINIHEFRNGADSVRRQTNTYSDAGFSQFYSTDSIAYTFSIPATAVSGDDLSYMGEVVNANGNTATRSITFTVQ